MNLWRRSLADRDSLLLSLRGLCGERSSGQQAPGRYAWPPPFLLLLFSFFLLVLWAGASSLLAQDSGRAEYKGGKVARLGWLGIDPAKVPHLRAAFFEGLRDLGYVEGRNLVVESRYTGGTLERAPAVAAELAALKLDVIVAGSTPNALAAKQATSSIPIVVTAASDPVGSGLVSSLARPGGNVTGLSFLNPELVGKHGTAQRGPPER